MIKFEKQLNDHIWIVGMLFLKYNVININNRQSRAEIMLTCSQLKGKNKSRDRSRRKNKSRVDSSTNNMIFHLDQTVKTTQAKTDLLRIALFHEDYNQNNKYFLEGQTRRSLLQDKFSDWNNQQPDQQVFTDHNKLHSDGKISQKTLSNQIQRKHRRYCTDNTKSKQWGKKDFIGKINTQKKQEQKQKLSCALEIGNSLKKIITDYKNNHHKQIYSQIEDNKQKIKWKQLSQKQTVPNNNSIQNDYKINITQVHVTQQDENKIAEQLQIVSQVQQIDCQKFDVHQSKKEVQKKQIQQNVKKKIDQSFHLKIHTTNREKQKVKQIKSRTKTAQTIKRRTTLYSSIKSRQRSKFRNSSDFPKGLQKCSQKQQNELQNNLKQEKKAQTQIRLPLKPTQFQLDLTCSQNKNKFYFNTLKGYTHLWKCKNSLNDSQKLLNLSYGMNGSFESPRRSYQDKPDSKKPETYRSKKASQNTSKMHTINQVKKEKGKWINYYKRNSNISRVYQINSNSPIKKQINALISLLKQEKQFKYNIYQNL